MAMAVVIPVVLVILLAIVGIIAYMKYGKKRNNSKGSYHAGYVYNYCISLELHKTNVLQKHKNNCDRSILFRFDMSFYFSVHNRKPVEVIREPSKEGVALTGSVPEPARPLR